MQEIGGSEILHKNEGSEILHKNGVRDFTQKKCSYFVKEILGSDILQKNEGSEILHTKIVVVDFAKKLGFEVLGRVRLSNLF